MSYDQGTIPASAVNNILPSITLCYKGAYGTVLNGGENRPANYDCFRYGDGDSKNVFSTSPGTSAGAYILKPGVYAAVSSVSASDVANHAYEMQLNYWRGSNKAHEVCQQVSCPDTYRGITASDIVVIPSSETITTTTDTSGNVSSDHVINTQYANGIDGSTNPIRFGDYPKDGAPDIPTTGPIPAGRILKTFLTITRLGDA